MTDPTPVRFLAAVLAREDEGLVEPCARNLRRMGFEHVAVFCIEELHLETETFKERFADDPGISVISAPTEMTHPDAGRMDGPMVGPLLARQPTEWMLAIDCDEFPVIDGGHVDALTEISGADMVVIPRFNYARRNDEDGSAILRYLKNLQDVPLIFGGRTAMRRPRDDGESLPRWCLHTIGPKLMIRPDRFEALTAGAHGGAGFKGEGDGPVVVSSKQMIIADFPFTTFERFRQKVINARAHLKLTNAHANPDSAWHWKWWIDLLKNGQLDDEFQRQGFDDAELENRRSSDEIQTPVEIFGR